MYTNMSKNHLDLNEIELPFNNLIKRKTPRRNRVLGHRNKSPQHTTHMDLSARYTYTKLVISSISHFHVVGKFGCLRLPTFNVGNSEN